LILYAWVLWLAPLVAVPFVPLVARAGPRATWTLAVSAVAVSLVSSLYVAITFASPVTESIGIWLPFLNVHLQTEVDGLSTLVSVLVSFLSLLVAVYSLGYMKGEGGFARYYALILLFVGGMLGLVMAGNLLQFYFFWEVVGICSALLIAFWSDREAARKAGLKAFVVTRIGDAALLLAVVIISMSLGTTSFGSVLGAVGGPVLSGGLLLLVGVLIFIGAMGKSAQVPLHSWLPDAMEGPTTVSALIHAATMVNAGVYLVLRLYPLFQSSAALLNLVLVVGLFSATVGGVCAIAAEDLKRILAYSTISQLGLMFVAIGLGSPLAGTYHLVSQGLFKALAFLAAGSVIHALDTRNVEEMGGLWRSMKYTYVGFLLSVLAMSGLPPLVGFWSKDAILSAAFGTGTAVAAIIVALDVVTALYSFRALLKVFHGPASHAGAAHEAPASMLVAILVLATSVGVGWLAMNTQDLVGMKSLTTVDPAALALSTAALALGLAVSVTAFSTKRSQTAALFQRSASLRSARETLLVGLGFDQLYRAIYEFAILPLGRLTSRLQTGRLGSDVSLMLLLLVALLVLAVVGVV
jgi:NADH-quinone oxidoreductase subunit L